MYHNFVLYESLIRDYSSKDKRLDRSGVENINRYVEEHISSYKIEQVTSADIERLSEYYPYKNIEKDMSGEPLKICNIGCFYCGADHHFLTKHPYCVVYGLDFGNILDINRGLQHPNLRLFPGYPLETLETFVKKERKGFLFDYTIFTRTATVINIEQLLSYMGFLAKLSKNTIFLEVSKLTTFSRGTLDVYKIDLMNPVKIYSGIYIHNYPKLLKDFGYVVTKEAILHHDAFDQGFTVDDEFIYVEGRRI